ncbi:MAG: hypothetical protein V3T05_04560 [Myxococcota bacterium]
MWARLVTNSIILGSLTVLGAVAYYFNAEYQDLTHRTRVLSELKKTVDNDGPCAALQRTRELDLSEDYDLGQVVTTLRRVYAGGIVGNRDDRALEALLDADSEDMVDRTLCEQIKLVRDLGDVHPVMELLRYTRQGADACEDPRGLEQVLAGLHSHRLVLLKSLLEDVSELRCLPSWLAANIAGLVLDEVRLEPDAMDELDVLRVAQFVETWAPIWAAQFACTVQASGGSSRLGATIGCTPYHRRQILPRYRYAKEVADEGLSPAMPAGSDVLLLREEGERCEVRPFDDPPRLLLVACKDLTLLSDLHMAVLVESIHFGLARASLIAGLVRYDGAADRVYPSTELPELRSWYGYSRNGDPLGMTQVVRMTDLAAKFGQEVPENPVRAYCRGLGAKFCYDVDWTQLVNELKGDAVVFLSRPMRLFLHDAHMARDVTDRLISSALGGTVPTHVTYRVFALGDGGYLIAAIEPGGVELSWRLGADGEWQTQSFGAKEGGGAPPSARLLAALDLRNDGRPEVLIQRIDRRNAADGPRDASDAIVLLALERSGKRFAALNTLTIHEY